MAAQSASPRLHRRSNSVAGSVIGASSVSRAMARPDRSAVNANAYAIAYRLLGDRAAAQAAIGIALQRVDAAGGLDRTDWLAVLASSTVEQSVGVAATGIRPSEPDSAQEGLRSALRRRLASASNDERTAAALHHLAGYSIDQVAAFMGRTPADVARLAGVIAPPPGVSYRDLGDPILIGGSATDDPRRRVRVSVSTALTALVVIALAIGASRCVGPRPSLGPAPAHVTAHVSADAPVVTSAGCSRPATPAGTYWSTTAQSPSASIAATSSPVPFRVAVPQQGVPTSDPSGSNVSTTNEGAPTPHPLLLAVTDAGESIDSFMTDTGLEQAAVEQGFLVATVAPHASGTIASVDDVAAVLNTMLSESCVDTSRVTVTGLGSGAQTATAFGCSQPQLVSVIAGVGGASVPGDCTLSPAVSLLLMWNADDQAFPPDGGYGPLAAPPSSAAAPLPPTAAGQAVSIWSRAIGAPEPERSTAEGGGSVEQSRSPSGAQVKWVSAPTGGHTWTPDTSQAILEYAEQHARSTG